MPLPDFIPEDQEHKYPGLTDPRRPPGGAIADFIPDPPDVGEAPSKEDEEAPSPEPKAKALTQTPPRGQGVTAPREAQQLPRDFYPDQGDANKFKAEQRAKKQAEKQAEKEVREE